MPLKLGDQDLTTAYLGTINIARMYLGSIQVLSTRQTFVQINERRGYFTDNANTLVLPHNVVAFVSMRGDPGHHNFNAPNSGPNGEVVSYWQPRIGADIWGVLNTGETTRTLTFSYENGQSGTNSLTGVGGDGFRIAQGSTILFNAYGGTGSGYAYTTDGGDSSCLLYTSPSPRD